MGESKMRWEQAAAEICDAVENSAAKIARNAADSLYETVMVSVQDYLRENVEFNLSSKLQGYADTAYRLRVENEQLKRRSDLVEPLVQALQSIRQYGSDTLSGRVDGPDDRQWQRESVLEMTRRARAALQAYEAAQ